MQARPAPASPRAIALLAGACLALAATSAFLLWKVSQPAGGVYFGEDALRDPEIRRQIVGQLMEGLSQPFDSHPDADVGRVLLPDAQRNGESTNALGMRERPIAVPKPPDVVRVVLLGDSFVFGLNVPADRRLGSELERLLVQGGVPGGQRFECLHLAVNSWNIHAECAFLRRQLERLEPDLVVQVSVANDLDDATGVRGFGAEATFSPQHRARADALVLDRYAQSFLRSDTRNLLGRGLDHESRQRFAEALADVRRLRADLARLPGAPRHLLVLHWGPLGPAAYEHLGRPLEEERPGSVLYVPLEFAADKSLWITPSDYHWNEEGHARVGRVLYGLVRSGGWLPVELAPREDLEAEAERWMREGHELVSTGAARMHATIKEYVAAIEWPELDLTEARQVYGGIDLEGLVSPYASLVLQRPPEARRLVVRAAGLPDRSLVELQPRVLVEEFELGRLELIPGREESFAFDLPAGVADREFLSVRFESDDWVYRGDDARHCVSFRFVRAALE
jgi:hypothetical protein